jgi:hypothetical protein
MKARPSAVFVVLISGVFYLLFQEMSQNDEKQQ